MTSSSGSITIEALSAADGAAVQELDQWAFAFAEDQVDPELALSQLEWDRTYGARLTGAGPISGGGLSGLYSVYSLRMPVPGAEIPCAGVTWVSVHPQHRRRGLLSALLRHHFTTVREAGVEAVSALHASEPAIYGRFGYGAPTPQVRYTIPFRAGLRPVPGEEEIQVRFELAIFEKHGDDVARLFDAARQGRPGMVGAVNPVHVRRRFDDLPATRAGHEAQRIALAVGPDGTARGYALFARRWGNVPQIDGTVSVRELNAADPAAAAALWRTLAGMDLMRRVVTDDRSLDDPLTFLLLDPRAARPELIDGTYVRLVDLPAALAARRYAAPVDVVLEVTDEWCPWNAGRWRLSGDLSGATCSPTTDPADLTLDVHELGSAYLGTHSLSGLAGAGLVDAGSSAVLGRAAAAFSWPVAATCAWGF